MSPAAKQVRGLGGGVAVQPAQHVGDVAVHLVPDAGLVDPARPRCRSSPGRDGRAAPASAWRRGGKGRASASCRSCRPSRGGSAARPRRLSIRTRWKPCGEVGGHAGGPRPRARRGTRSSASTSRIQSPVQAAMPALRRSPSSSQAPSSTRAAPPLPCPAGDGAAAVGAAVEHHHQLIGRRQAFQAGGQASRLVPGDHQGGEAGLTFGRSGRARLPPVRHAGTAAEQQPLGSVQRRVQRQVRHGVEPRRAGRHGGRGARPGGRVVVDAARDRTGRASACRSPPRGASGRNHCRRRARSAPAPPPLRARTARRPGPPRAPRPAPSSTGAAIARSAAPGPPSTATRAPASGPCRRREGVGERHEALRRPDLPRPNSRWGRGRAIARRRAEASPRAAHRLVRTTPRAAAAGSRPSSAPSCASRCPGRRPPRHHHPPLGADRPGEAGGAEVHHQVPARARHLPPQLPPVQPEAALGQREWSRRGSASGRRRPRPRARRRPPPWRAGGRAAGGSAARWRARRRRSGWR